MFRIASFAGGLMQIDAASWTLAAFVVLALAYVVLLSGERVQGRNLLWDFSWVWALVAWR